MKLASSKGWSIDLYGSFANGYEAEIEAPKGHVITGTDSDYQYLCNPESCSISELIDEILFIINDIGSQAETN